MALAREVVTLTTVNKFAQAVAKREGKSKELSIAQISEVLKITRTLLRRAGVDIYRVIGSTPTQVFDNGKAGA